MRALEPDRSGYVDCDGIDIYYEVFGSGSPTLLLLPTWNILHTRFWKMQVPYLARHFRVVTYDGPGNGRSGRPLDPRAYDMRSLVAYALAVLDETKTGRVVVASLSQAAAWSLDLATGYPERVLGQIFIGCGLPLAPPLPERASIADNFFETIEDPQGWAKMNARYWQTNYEDFLEFFFDQCFSEPHSTNQIEDAVGWGLETAPDLLLAEYQAEFGFDGRDEVLERFQRNASPSLLIHGDEDRISPLARAEALAAAVDGTLATLKGTGHIPLTRDPVKVNLLIKEFVDRIAECAEVVA